MMIVFGSPSRYVQGPGSLSHLGVELARIADTAVLVLDPLIQDRYGEIIAASCRDAGVTAQQLRFGGECTPAEIDRLAALAGRPATVAAAGGGKCIDAGKALANRHGASVVTIPTIASTDAPTSHNYVMYDESHRMLAVEKLNRNPALVIVDTEVIARAPKKLFVAGIGDAIGKIYEADACYAAGGINVFGGGSSYAAVLLGRACHRVLQDDALAALAAIDAGTPDAALERVVEATVLMSGLAFESGGLSIAHSMTRGLTAVRPWADALHGFQVAYYRQVGLPCSLTELAAPPTGEVMDIIASRTMTAPHIRHFPRVVTSPDLLAAMAWVEESFARL
jgi:glycerol dehydrogenase